MCLVVFALFVFLVLCLALSEYVWTAFGEMAVHFVILLGTVLIVTSLAGESVVDERISGASEL